MQVPWADLDNQSRSISLENENGGLTETLYDRKVALNNIRKALEEGTKARKAMALVFGALERQVSDL